MNADTVQTADEDFSFALEAMIRAKGYEVAPKIVAPALVKEEKLEPVVDVTPRVASLEEFKAFVLKAKPKFKWYWHCIKIAKVLVRVANGELSRVMIFAPPRHGKSELLSRLFSAYYLSVFPDRWVGVNSYAAELAFSLSRSARENFITNGGKVSDAAGAVNHWETNQGGGFWAAGVGGPIAGKGFHCFPKDTHVLTESGKIEIGNLCRLQARPRVLSFNHGTKSLEWRAIIAAAAHLRRPLVEVAFVSGRRLRCTPDHPIFTSERGYRAAGDLVPGQSVIQVSNVQELRSVRHGDRPQRALSRLLPQDQEVSLSISVRDVRDRVHSFALSSGKGTQSNVPGVLLLDRVQSDPSRYKEPAIMQSVFIARKQEHAPILRDVPTVAISNMAAARQATMRVLRRTIPTPEPSFSLLPREVVRRPGTLDPHERQGQQSLQRRNELRELVSKDAPGDLPERFGSMRRVREIPHKVQDATKTQEREISSPFMFADSPYRSRSEKQPCDQSGNALSRMPQEASQTGGCWKSDTVSSVVELCGEGESVYDIQVEGNSNFFAEGILVHNCGIIDDPIKNAADATSRAINEGQQEWYPSTLYPREEPGGSIVIMMTRWNAADLCGWLLAQESSVEGEEPERWHIVSFEAIKEGSLIEIPSTCTLEPDERLIGEALCPDRYPLAKLNKIKKRVGTYYWNALYRQRPTAREGGMFKLHELPIVDAAPAGAGIQRIRYWDLGGSDSKKADFSVGCLMSKTPEGLYYIEHIERGQWSPKERNEHIRATADADVEQFGKMTTWIEKVPGLAVEVIDNIVKVMAGHNVHTEMAKNDKVTRADPLASQCEAKNVRVVKAEWNAAFRDELTAFDNGLHDDQVDAASGAFSKLEKKRKGSPWVGV